MLVLLSVMDLCGRIPINNNYIYSGPEPACNYRNSVRQMSRDHNLTWAIVKIVSVRSEPKLEISLKQTEEDKEAGPQFRSHYGVIIL